MEFGEIVYIRSMQFCIHQNFKLCDILGEAGVAGGVDLVSVVDVHVVSENIMYPGEVFASDEILPVVFSIDWILTGRFYALFLYTFVNN